MLKDKLNNRNLTFKVALLFISSVIIFLILSVVVILIIEWKIIKGETEKHIKSKTEIISISMSYPLWSVDHEQIHKLLVAEMLDEEIAGIYVSASGANDRYCIYRKTDTVYYKRDVVDKRFLERMFSSVFSNTRNIGFNNDNAGSVTVYSSNNYIRSKLARNTIRTLVQFSILIPIVILVIFYAFQRMIIRPIINLSGSVSSYTGSKFRIRPDVRSNDEIGELAAKFNVMADTIEHDMNEIRNAREEILKLNRDLENRVEERTGELAVAKERAEISDRMKSAFLATMSHELRTPLNSIIGFTGILLAQIPGVLNAEQMKQMGMVKASSQHLLDLINDVLDISKIEAGELVVSIIRFDYRETVNKVLSVVQPLADKKEILLRLEIPEDIGEIVSDKRRVEQILLNLVNNAIKFTNSGSVRIECQRMEKQIITRVIDTGIGIDKSDIEKLFKPFSQIESGLARHHEGTGLGLSISRRLAEKLGGSITVESVIDEGSTFTVTLPIGC